MVDWTPLKFTTSLIVVAKTLPPASSEVNSDAGLPQVIVQVLAVYSMQR